MRNKRLVTLFLALVMILQVMAPLNVAQAAPEEKVIRVKSGQTLYINSVDAGLDLDELDQEEQPQSVQSSQSVQSYSMFRMRSKPKIDHTNYYYNFKMRWIITGVSSGKFDWDGVFKDPDKGEVRDWIEVPVYQYLDGVRVKDDKGNDVKYTIRLRDKRGTYDIVDEHNKPVKARVYSDDKQPYTYGVALEDFGENIELLLDYRQGTPLQQGTFQYGPDGNVYKDLMLTYTVNQLASSKIASKWYVQESTEKPDISTMFMSGASEFAFNAPKDDKPIYFRTGYGGTVPELDLRSGIELWVGTTDDLDNDFDGSFEEKYLVSHKDNKDQRPQEFKGKRFLVNLQYNNTKGGLFTIREELTVTFDANKGAFTDTTTTKDVKIGMGLDLAEQELPTKDGKQALGWATSSTAGQIDENILKNIQKSQTLYAVYSTDIIPGTGNEKPADFVTVTFDLDGKGTTTDETVYYVNPTAGKTMKDIKVPTVKGSIGYTEKNTWTPAFTDTTAITTDLKYTAEYEKIEDIVPKVDPSTKDENTKPDGYVTITFDLDGKGTTENETVFYVNPTVGKTMGDITPPTVKANTGFIPLTGLKAWIPTYQTKTVITVDETYVAQYDTSADIIPGTGNTKPEGYVTVKFETDPQGSLEGETTYYVKPTAGKTMADITVPTAKPSEGYKIAENPWDPAIVGTTKLETKDAVITHTAKYEMTDAKKLEGKLNPKDIVVWKDSPVADIDWKTGLELTDPTLQTILDNGVVKEGTKPARKTDEVGKLPGSLLVSFNDGSSLEVTGHNLLVVDNVVKDNDPNTPIPEGAITVTFKKGEGVTSLENEVNNEVTYKVQPNYKLKDSDFPVAQTNGAEYGPTVTWDPTDHTVTENNKVFTAIAKKKVIDLQENEETPEGYVKLTFDPTTEGKIGSLEAGKVKSIAVLKGTLFNDDKVIEKLEASKPSPTDATKEFSRWNPLFPERGIVVEETFVAQYMDKGKIKEVQKPGVDEVPAGYVRLTFDATDKGLIGQTQILAIDVRSNLTYDDADLQAKIKEIKAEPKDRSKKFSKWLDEKGQDLPTTGNVATAKFTAEYVSRDLVLTENPYDPDYGRVDFLVREVDYDKGFIGTTQTKTFWVFKGKTVAELEEARPTPFKTPEVRNKPGFTHKGWEVRVGGRGSIVYGKDLKAGTSNTGPTAAFNEALVTESVSHRLFTAVFDSKTQVSLTDPKDDDYVRIAFLPGTEGKLNPVTENQDYMEYYVLKNLKWGQLKENGAFVIPKVSYEDTNKAFDKWDPLLPGDSEEVKAGEYTAVASEKVIPKVNPDTKEENQKPEGYVAVTFKAGTNGTLEGETVYYVNPKLAVTMAEITEPTIKPNTGYDVASKKWEPVIEKRLVIIEDLEYTAEYIEKGIVIPADEVKEKPEGYATVTFEAGDNGTLVGTTSYYVNPEKAGTIADSKINPPEIKANVGYRPADEKWSPVFEGTTAITKDGELTYTAQYTPLEPIIEGGENVEKPEGYVTIEFDLAGKGTTRDKTEYYVNPEAGKTMAEITAPTVTAKTGYTFNDAWLPTFDNTTPITEAKKYLAQYTKLDDIIPGKNPDTGENNTKPEGYVTVNFDLDGKGTTENETIFYVNPESGKTMAEITAPTVTAKAGYTLAEGEQAWIPVIDNSREIKQDLYYTARYTETKDIIPGGEGIRKPDGYIEVVFNLDGKGTSSDRTIFYVRPEAGKTMADIRVPKVIASTGYEVNTDTPWNPAIDKATAINSKVPNGKLEYTAQYKELAIVSETEITGYHKVQFHSGNNGSFKENAKTLYYVKPGTSWTDVKADNLFTIPEVRSKIGYKVDENSPWSPEIKGETLINNDYNITAQYLALADVIEKKDGVTQPEGYVTVEFVIKDTDNAKGKFAENVTTTFFVNPTKEVVLAEPSIELTEPFIHTGWSQSPSGEYVKGVAKKYTENTTLTAIFEDSRDIIPGTEDKPEGFITITFKEGENGKFADTVKDGQKSLHVRANKEITLPAPDIVASTGFKFTGWNPDVSQKQAYTKDTEVTAEYEAYDDVIPGKDPNTGKDNTKPEGYVTVEFKAVDGEATLTGETVYYVNPVNVKTLADATNITEPEIKAEVGFKVKDQKWNPNFADNTAITKDNDPMVFTANMEKLPSIIPGDQTKPEGYVTITFEPGENGKFKEGVKDTEKTFYINPEEEVVLTEKGNALKEKIEANRGWKFSTWNANLAESRYYKKDLTITALYNEEKDVVDKEVPGYVKVIFKTDTEKGNFVKDAKTVFYVNPDKEVSLAAPGIEGVTGYKHTGWDKDLTKAHQYTEETIINATYEELADIIEGGEQPKGYIKVTLNATDEGIFKDNAKTKDFWVKPGTLTSEFEKPDASKKTHEFKGWENDPGTINSETTLNATYEKKPFDEKNIISMVVNMPTKKEYKENENFEEAGMTVVLKDANGNTKTVTADNFDNEGITIKPDNGDKLTVAENNDKPVTATKEFIQENGVTGKVTGTTKENLLVTAADKMTTPTIKQPVEGDTNVTGTADPNAKVEVTLPNGDTVTTTADDKGQWSVTTDPLKKDQKVVVVAKDPEGKKADSDKAEKSVVPRPAKPTVDKITEGEDSIKVLPPIDGDKIEIKLPGGDKVVVEKDTDGNWIVTEGKTDPEKEVTTDEDGNLVIPVAPEKVGPAGKDVTITVTDKETGGTSEPTEVGIDPKTDPEPEPEPEVKPEDQEKPGKPTVKEITEGDDSIKVTPPTDGDKIEITIPGEEKPIVVEKDGDDWKIGNDVVKKDDKGKLEIPVDPDNIVKDKKITIKVTDKTTDKTSDPVEKTVLEKSKTPEVDKITAGDDKITGTGQPGSSIVVELPDGTKINATVSSEGNWSVDVPADKELVKDDIVKVTQKEEGKGPSDPAEKTVGEKPAPGPGTDPTPPAPEPEPKPEQPETPDRPDKPAPKPGQPSPGTPGRPGKPSTPITPPAKKEDVTVEIIAGADRFDTAVEISKKAFDQSDVVVLAAGRSYPDSLVASVLAAKLKAPLLLVEKDSIPAKVMAEIQRLGAKKVYMAGGAGTIAMGLEKGLERDGYTTLRLFGKDRYQTSEEIAKHLIDVLGVSEDQLIFADGRQFADALAISPYAGKTLSPILLVNQDLSDYAQTLLTKASRAIISGGSNSVSPAVERAIQARVAHTERISGKDRYATAEAIRLRFFKDATTATLASGEVYPDALTGSVLAIKKDAPMLLVRQAGPTQAQLEAIKDSKIKEIFIFGGSSTVAPAAAAAFRSIVR